MTDFTHEFAEDSPTRAFSIRWPYVAFSNSKFLIIINAFDTKTITRIELQQSNTAYQIVQTFITNSNDLLALVRTHDEFILFCVDLDASNIYELEKAEEIEHIFEP